MNFSAFCGVSALALLAATASVANAAEARDADDQTGAANDASAENSGEIVVSARKRLETVLDVPASITVLSQTELLQKNISNANELGAAVPGLIMSNGPGGMPGTSFRGLGSNASAFSLEASVAQYQDGVYLGHARDYVAPLYDVERVEFIKGTQSTLLGKNTSLGAISIVNHSPTDKLGYRLDLSHSFEIDGWKADGAINIPLSDRLQVRLAGLYTVDDGYVQNAFSGERAQHSENLSGRLLLAWQPGDGVDFKLSYQHDRRRIDGQNLQMVTDRNGLVAARSTAAGFTFNVTEIDVAGWGSSAMRVPSAGLLPFDNQDADRLNGIASIDLGGAVLTSQTAYVKWGSDRSLDFDFIPTNLFNLTDFEDNRIFSQELRVASTGTAPFQYVAGVYYYDNQWDYRRISGGPLTNSLGFALTGVADSNTRLTTDAFSVFGSASYEVMAGLKVDAGLRYTSERKDGNFVRVSSGAFAGAQPSIPLTTYQTQKADPVDYNFGLQYKPSANTMLYAFHAKGSKSGGFQDVPVTLAGAPFAPETAYSSEIGIKQKLPGGFATVALFNTLVKDFQTSYTASVGTPPVTQSLIGNSDVRSRGVDVSVRIEPVEGLKASGSVIYAKSKFMNPFPANGSIAKVGDPLTRAPEWSGNFSLDYEGQVASGWKMFAGATVDFSSKTLFQFVTPRPTAPYAESHATVDARIGLRSDDDRWAVSLIGTNIFDRRYVTFASAISLSGDAYYGGYNRPRVIALQLSVRN